MYLLATQKRQLEVVRWKAQVRHSAEAKAISDTINKFSNQWLLPQLRFSGITLSAVNLTCKINLKFIFVVGFEVGRRVCRKPKFETFHAGSWKQNIVHCYFICVLFRHEFHVCSPSPSIIDQTSSLRQNKELRPRKSAFKSWSTSQFGTAFMSI